MNIPLDRLYYFLRDAAQEIYGDPVVIYRFWPDGAKNINNLTLVNEHGFPGLGDNEWKTRVTSPSIFCHDQEPLDYEYYSRSQRNETGPWNDVLKSIDRYKPSKNLYVIKHSFFEKTILLHSEQRSWNLDQYILDDQMVPTYFWSHAVIARDWFRYAQHEKFVKKSTQTFLIYNRAWNHTREYRLKFADLLIDYGLADLCRFTCNVVDPELNIHYSEHVWKNPSWKPSNQLENFFQPTEAPSHSSADFNTADYNNTDIEVVLETLFDDSRLHLTEKSLRPIACGQPFILAATHGSLSYLRRYGFKTFDSIWDESYDLIQDPLQRLIKIVDLMKEIASWDEVTREIKLTQAQEIVQFNQKRFFSQDFFNTVIDELKTNLTKAFVHLDKSKNYKGWIDKWEDLLSFDQIKIFLETNTDIKRPTRDQVDSALDLARNNIEKKL